MSPHKVVVQARSLLFIPGCCVVKVCQCCWPKDSRQTHGCNRERVCDLTCSQAMTSSGLASSLLPVAPIPDAGSRSGMEDLLFTRYHAQPAETSFVCMPCLLLAVVLLE